jgi:hypothetical protein
MSPLCFFCLHGKSIKKVEPFWNVLAMNIIADRKDLIMNF